MSGRALIIADGSMKICHYAKYKDRFFGGLRAAVGLQRKSLEMAGVDYITEPSEEFDILHTNLPDPLSLYQLYKAQKTGKKTVIHTHTTHRDFEGSFRFSNYLKNPLKHYIKHIYKQADLLISPSSYNRRVVEKYGFENIEVISNGVDTDKISYTGQERQRAREKYGVDGTVIFCVGTVFQRKGPDTFNTVASKMADTDFRWFGKKVSGLFAEQGTSRLINQSPTNVQFTGYVDKVSDAFAAGDIFFYPTYEENQGIPALEAAYSKKPIVLRDIPVFDEYFTHGENCLKANSVDGFRECLQQLKDDPDLRDRLSENAYQMAKQHTLEKIGEKLKKQYAKLME